MLLLSNSAFAEPQGEQDIAEESAALPASTELATVDNGDGTFSIVLPPELVPTENMVSGPLIFEYVGQARLLYDKPRWEAGRFHNPPARKSILDELGTVRVDSLGRRWEVVDVNREMVCAQLGKEPDCDLERRRRRKGSRGYWIPQSVQAVEGLE